jgi:hypothetical protein
LLISVGKQAISKEADVKKKYLMFGLREMKWRVEERRGEDGQNI